MDPHDIGESSSGVFLTQTKTAVMFPVQYMQQALDDQPELETLFRAQTMRQSALRGIGLTREKTQEEKALSYKEKIDHEEEELAKERLRKVEEKLRFEAFEEQRRVENERRKQEYLQKAKRHWEITMKKITFQPPSEDYYYESPVKPGYQFFRQLVAARTLTRRKLHVFIPDTLVIGDERSMICTEDTPQGPVLTIHTEFRIVDFLKKFEKCKVREGPAAIMRLPSGAMECFKALPLSYYEFSDKLIRSQFPYPSLVQVFLPPHSGRPAVTRLFYDALSRANRSSYAFVITATDAGMKKQFGSAILLAESLDGFEAYPMTGKAIVEYEAVAREVVEYFESAFNVRIEDIVLDFIQDENGRKWLIGCKGVTVSAAAELVKQVKAQQEAGKSPQEIHEMRAGQMEELLASSHCRLCLLPYKPHEMAHVLPFKTLLLFKRHCHKSGRKIHDLSHLRITKMETLTHWMRLCDICYMLVVHECELIETERQLARALNVPVESDNVMAKVTIVQPSYMPHVMRQWRVLLYFRQLEACNADKLLGLSLHVEFTMFDRLCCYPLQPTWSTESRSTAECHTARVFYFFASSVREVQQLGQSLTVQFLLKKSLQSATPLCVGESKLLAPFTCNTAALPAVCEPTCVLLFRRGELAARLLVTVGLAYDREVSVKQLPVSITRLGHIYVPEASYCSSEPLPDAWVETFSSEYAGLERTNVLSTSRIIEGMYTARLSDKEILGSLRDSSKGSSWSPRHRTRAVGVGMKASQSSRFLELKERTMKVHGLKGKQDPAKYLPTSLSTSTSSKVLYSLDQSRGLLSPTFLSPRVASRPHSHRDLNASDSLTDGQLCSDEQGWKQLSGRVDRFLRERAVVHTEPDQEVGSRPQSAKKKRVLVRHLRRAPTAPRS